jgi:hypothetical protein
MTEPDELLDQLRKLKAEDKRLEAAREQIKQQVVELVITAVRRGIEPADIYDASPYSQVWLRARIREAGIPPATPGTKPRAGRGTARPMPKPTNRAAKPRKES